MILTPSQLEAIQITDPSVDTCIVAGPGSGKTTVLVARFRCLVEAGIPPHRILAVTFTEKAAREMKGRLARSIGAADDLRVGTVHAFCARLLRENAVQAGIDPAFRILEEHEADALERNIAREALDALVIERPAEMREVLAWLASPDMAESIREVCETLRASGAMTADLEAELPAPDEAIAGILALCERVAAARVFDWTASQREQWTNVLRWAARLRAIDGGPPGEAHLDVLNQFDCKLNRVKRDGEASALLRELKNDRIPAAQSGLVTAVHQPRRQTLIAAIERFDAAFRRRKRDLGVLDFSDLEEFSVRLLRSDGRIRDDVRGQFDHILMDEFQDTNGVQSALVDLLRRPGRFYAVGDINQAIYGFRHADPLVFRRYRATAGRVVELRENWRSRPDILCAALTILDGAKGIEPHRLIAARPAAGAGEPAVEVIQCPRMDLEAQWVARRIVELRHTQQSYAGFALLFRSTAPMPLFAQALEAERVPFVVNAGRGFWEQQEIMDLVNLLRVSANSLDELSRAAVLRSPLFGVSDDALLLLKDKESLSPEDRERVDRYETNLARYRHLPPDRILIHAMDETAYEAGLSPRARANVEKLLDLVRRPALSLGELVDQLQVYRSADPREADTAIDDEVDAVRLQTIHAAKGLEFPVVFLPALHTGVQNDAPPIAFFPGRGMGVRWRNPATAESMSDAIHGAMSPEIRREQAEEADRLFYVAMTRAEERLVLSYSGKSHWAGAVANRFKVELGAPGEPRRIDVQAPDGAVFPVSVFYTEFPPPAWPSDRPPTEAASGTIYLDKPAISGQYDEAASVTSVALFAHCPRRFHLERTVPGSRRASQTGGGTTDIGLQVHAILAGAPEDKADPEAIELAERFRRSDLGRRVSRTLLAEREFDFMLAVEDIVLSGRIDLWFEENGELILVDYKTEAADFATVSHELQVRLYAMVLERTIGKPVDAAYVYLLRRDVAQAVDCGAAAIAEAVRQIRQFRDAQESGSFPLREGPHCLVCPYFQSACPANDIQLDI